MSDTRLAPGVRLGTYEIKDVIGAGGMGVVARAHDARLQRDVAIKQVLNAAGDHDSALREARAASALSHPNICTVHEVFESDGASFIVMELVAGQPLDQLLTSKGLPPSSVVQLGLQIADAVGHAHERGLVHGDLKTANVVVSPEGRLKLLDFGLARPLRGDDLNTLTHSQEPGVAAGTLAYMAPELLRGEVPDRRTDIWAIGVMLYEMATGRRPFDGSTGYALSAAIIGGEIAQPESIPRELAAVIVRCLSRDPRERYGRGEELRAALQAVADAGRVPPSTKTLPPMGPALAVVVILTLVAAGVAWLTSSRRGDPGMPEVRSLAVLPFSDIAGDQRFLADGMTDALISDLSKVPALRVIARTSAMRYRDTDKPLDAIARELGVDALVDGSITRAGDRVRVTVALVDPASNHQRWSDSYDRQASDVLALQREISGTIATELRGVLSTSGLPPPHAVDPEAHEAYLRGRYHWSRRSEADLRKSLDYFKQAIVKEPTLARAHVGLAQAYAVLGFYVWLPPEDAFPRAKAAATQALQFEPENEEAHAVLGYSRLYYDWDWTAAEADFARALKINPGSALAHQWYANYLTAMGQWDLALEHMRRAHELDPLSTIMTAASGWIQCFAGRPQEAINVLQRTRSLDAQFLQTYLWLAWAHGDLGNWTAARGQAAHAVELSSRSRVAVAALARVAAGGGQTAEARELLKELRVDSGTIYVPRYDLALVHAALGEAAPALALLEEAFTARENQLVFLRWDSRLASLRAHPRFQALVDRMKF